MAPLIYFPVDVTEIWCFLQFPSVSCCMYVHLPTCCFQWDGSRFPRSCQKKSEAGTAVLSVVQGSHFNKLPLWLMYRSPVAMFYHFPLVNICSLIIIHFQMQETIPVTQLVRETAAVMQEFTQSGYATILCTFYLLYY